MKSKKKSFPHTLKIVLIILIYLNNTAFFGQETPMEDAVVSISFSEEKDSKTIVATALDQSGLPIEDLELYFYVERTFSLLPIGDIFNSTDENGEVEVEFPIDLPADENGNVTIVVKIMESDLYNDLTLEMIKKWGVPAKLDESEEKRSLWAAAANAPITLILSVSGMIIGIWFIIFYILIYLYKISRIRPIHN